MSQRAQVFVDSWIEDNIHALAFEPDGDATESTLRAKECYHVASPAGISQGDIDETLGNLVEYMAAAIARANHQEVKRLFDK
jgi:hypothetical protein